ncbi:MAG: cupin domain-containing protein [Nitrospinae bacterium]|nr:cupin domain-containing protein [Nitrospinota bacterium]
MNILRWDEREDGPFSKDSLKTKLVSLGFAPVEYVYPPGLVFPPHIHHYDKMAAVVSGHFKFTMGGNSVILTTGEAIFVPAMELHSAEVAGNEAVVSLDAEKV